jgi:hypothetical protein
VRWLCAVGVEFGILVAHPCVVELEPTICCMMKVSVTSEIIVIANGYAFRCHTLVIDKATHCLIEMLMR